MSGESLLKPEQEKKFFLREQRGMALLITVMTVSLLVAITIQYHKSTWQQFLVSNSYKVESQLKAITDSGVNIAQVLLEQDGQGTDDEGNQADFLQESWAVLSRDQLSGLFPSGSLQLKIIDLSGRLQLNSLVQKEAENPEAGTSDNTEDEIRSMLRRLLLSGIFPIQDETEAQGIVDALVDWIDEDDQESDYGAESSYYRSLDRPYSCRNGPIRDLEELLLVKGITPALLFGSGTDKGLAGYLTVTGSDGKVNINTAPLPVIKSFDALISDELLEKFDEFRREEENQETLANLLWYKEIGGWPGDIVLNDRLLTIKSSYFQIAATGEFDTLSRSVVAVAHRTNENKVNLLGKKRSNL